MNVYCGISLDENVMFFSFLSFNRGVLSYISDASLEFPSPPDSLEAFLKRHIDAIDEVIREKERKKSFKTGKIFFALDDAYTHKKVVEDVVSLNVRKHRKRIRPRDIRTAQKQIESISLKWEEVPLHHLVLEYGAGGVRYLAAPVGTLARKLALKSLIISTQHRLVDSAESVFDNINRRFSGFVYKGMAEYGAVAIKDAEPCVIVNVGLRSTRVSCYREGDMLHNLQYPFSERDIISAIAKKFTISEGLASHLLFSYGSFIDASIEKEISVKEEGRYVNLSARSLHSLIKRVVYEGMMCIVRDAKQKIQADDASVSVIGRIAALEGFYAFMREADVFSLFEPAFRTVSHAASGCVRYGVHRFLEFKEKHGSFFQKMLSVYRDYF